MVQDLQPRPALPLDGRDGEAVWQNCRQRALQRSRPARAVAHWRGARKAERLRRGGAGLRDRRRPLPRAAADCRRCQLSRRPRVGKTGRHRRIRPGGRRPGHRGLHRFHHVLSRRQFRARHHAYIALAFVLPVIVVILGVYYYTALITFFFTWASLHVLHQIIYLTDCYRTRAAVTEQPWSRLLDYGLVMTGLYPIGLYKMSLRLFLVGGVVLPYPDFLRAFHLPILAGVVFFLFLFAWIAKTIAEFREGRGSVPKTLLISVTTVVSFCLPMGSNLDVLFQGYNTWHSFQYLFLLWLINRLRDQRGEISSPFVQRLVRGKSMVPYYLCFLAATGVIVVLTILVRAVTPLKPDQSYFVVVLSVLLMHYYFDHFLFSHPRMIE